MINEDKKETCHPELVSGSHKEVGSQHKEEMLKRVQHDMKGRHCERSVAIQNNSTSPPHPNPQPYGTQSHSAHKFAGSTSVPQGAREQSYEIPEQVRNDMKDKFLVP